MMLFTVLSCKDNDNEQAADKNTAANVRFDNLKWQTREGELYPFREKMLQDLMDNGKLKGLSKPQLLEKLGPPDRENENYLYYLVSQQKVGILALNTKTLVIRLSPENVVEAVLIHG